MGKFPTKLITIEAISDKPDKRQAALKADGVWYTIWKDFEGSPTDEYSQLTMGNHDQPFKKGDSALISYKAGEYQGKPQYTIKSIFPGDSSRTTQVTGTAIKPHSEAPVASGSGSRDEFSRRLGVQGHINALLSNPNVLRTITSEDGKYVDVRALVYFATKVEDEAEKQLNPSPLRQSVARHAPRVVKPVSAEPEPEHSDDEYQGPDEINVEDIPF